MRHYAEADIPRATGSLPRRHALLATKGLER